MRRLLVFCETVHAVLREIFDESAYERFLENKCVVSSRLAYGEFIQETERARARRPRCC